MDQMSLNQKPGQADTLANSFQFGSSMFSAPEQKQKPYNSYLFGYPIAHSLAPQLHAALFSEINVPWTYVLYESRDKDDFLHKLRGSECIGSAITMPHKVTFVSEVDSITEEAQLIGAINTVFKRRINGETKLIGTNTDCIGIREAFLRNSPDVSNQSFGRPGLIIGGGGTCRSSIYALWKWMGVSKIYIVNRLRDEVMDIISSFEKRPQFTGELILVDSVEQAEALESPALIVGCVPDLVPEEPGEVLARQVATTFLKKETKGVILEMCYHPKPRTTFFELAEGCGWKVIPGTEAMIYQGVAQQSLWLELPIDLFNVRYAEGVVKSILDNS